MGVWDIESFLESFQFEELYFSLIESILSVVYSDKLIKFNLLAEGIRWSLSPVSTRPISSPRRPRVFGPHLQGHPVLLSPCFSLYNLPTGEVTG